MTERGKIENPEYGRMMRRMLRSYARRVGDMDIAGLKDLADFARDTEVALTEAVHRLRSEDGGAYSWAQIGAALGISRQAAQKRFGGDGARAVGGQPSRLR